MVTSNKQPDKKVVKMAEQSNSAVVPQRTLLGEVNEHITCPLCRGYYIDATTIVECLHSFCRSCIIKHLQVKSYCPVCEMLINSAKPNIKLDKALQDIVYKLVPGLFQKEMERRQQFYSSRPGPAASATPEQRGEDTERIIFSPEDVISFSLEFADATDTDSISSKSSDSNEPQPTSATMRRYLQCPAVVNINHLKKFLSMKFDIDSTQFAIDILYKRVPLPDYYTLMDIAYIYNWKRNEPMRFFYQIIDYVAIRNRLFDINKKGSHFRDCRSSPARTEDTSTSSPAPNLNDHGSEASSGTDSPMPDDNSIKQSDSSKKIIKSTPQSKEHSSTQDCTNVVKSSCPSPAKKNDDEVEKSQFLNSFELTAKNSSLPTKSSPGKTNVSEGVTPPKEVAPKVQTSSPKVEDSTLKRKQQLPPHTPELKKIKIELEKAKIPSVKLKPSDAPLPMQPPPSVQKTVSPLKLQVPRPEPKSNVKPEASGPKPPPPTVQKMVSPLKLHIPKLETQTASPKSSEVHKPPVKKIPDLKPSVPSSQSQIKTPPVNKVRMELLANNSDPTKDRSKILSQVKTSLGIQNAGQTSGDPLKSLFDSCKIPSSLSITLTDQKLDARSPGDPVGTDQKKTMVNKNLAGASNNSAHKVPSPPVHNYIEILKLPDTDPKKGKSESNNDVKPSPSIKPEASMTPTKPPNKSSETSTKGPIPNLKPISDTKLGKQSGNFSSPITFQQTFEKQIQSMQSDKKSKVPKNKAQVPKLVPATPKSFNVANKPNNPPTKPTTSGLLPMEHKPSAALDLSTPHNVQTKMTNQQQTLETMQSIANLAKKFTPLKSPYTLAQNSIFLGMVNTSLPAGGSPLRVPSASSINQMKMDKGPPGGPQFSSSRQEFHNKGSTVKSTNAGNAKMTSPGYQNVHHAQSTAQPSPRLQTRSPSSSPKLVIAEEKQGSSSSDHSANQSNQISSSHLSSMSMQKTESPKAAPGPSMSEIKLDKPLIAKSNVTGIRQPITPLKSSPPVSSADFLQQPHILAHQALLRQMELHKYQNRFDFLKNMTNLAHQALNDFNDKDKQ